MEQFEEKMKKSLNALSEEYATIRATEPHVDRRRLNWSRFY